MANIFLTSDTHFGHANMLTFKRENGSPVRPFTSVEEMDETLVDNWNRVVRPEDKVYHLGDVVINKKQLPTLKRLNGHKRLLFGNHDIFGYKEYAEYFEKMAAYRVFDHMVWAHIPLHPTAINERWVGQVHGHLHHRKVTRAVEIANYTVPQVDPRYQSVCVELTSYTPVEVSEVKRRFKG